jgi:hypothetical protein
VQQDGVFTLLGLLGADEVNFLPQHLPLASGSPDDGVALPLKEVSNLVFQAGALAGGVHLQ